jgi:cytochrome P450
VHSFRPSIRRLVVELLDRVRSTGEMDMIRDFACPLPLFVVSEIIGVPEEHRELMKRCAIDIVTFFGTSPDSYAHHARAALRSVQEAGDRLLELLSERRRAPRMDLLTGLNQAADRGDVRSDEELVAVCIMLVFAAFETTTNLLGNGMLTLLRHPEQLQLLRERPELMKSAIDEMLRFETPVQRLSRMAAEDQEIRGRAIKTGDLMFLIAGAANRDPARFAAPDRFDCARGDSGHLGFGFHIHTCPGSTLAHLEASVAFSEILQRMPDLKLACDAPDWVENLSVRSLKTLPLKFSS